MTKEWVSATVGNFTQSEEISATAQRSLHTFEVLDYDVFNGNYALIYKDIQISHSQSLAIKRECVPYEGDIYVQFEYSNGVLPASATELHNESEETVSRGTRTVTWKLHYKINGNIFSVDLATFNCSNDGVDLTASGQRIYGISMQATEEFIVYSYELQNCIFAPPLGVGTGYIYDSPFNLEDWNTNQLGDTLWERSKQVVGLINIKDGVASDEGYRKHQEYDILSPQQYAVGVVYE
jgi:hypothetical protein